MEIPSLWFNLICKRMKISFSNAGLVAFREKVETTVARYDVEEISERCAIVLIRQALAAAGEGE
jgi:hypothetical protein